jgi:hypothetical protein
VGEVGRVHARRGRRLTQRRRHRVGDVGGTAARRRRATGLPAHGVLGVDDDSLDLRAAQIDAAAQRHQDPASSSRSIQRQMTSTA